MLKKDIEYIFSNKKAVKSGSLIEIYTFGRDFIIGKTRLINNKKKSTVNPW